MCAILHRIPVLNFAFVLAVFAQPLQAADFGARLGFDHWQQDFSGFIDSTNTEIGRVDVNDDLGFSDDAAPSYYVVLEHPLGVVPNLRLQYTELEAQQSNTLNRSINYDGVAFAANQDVHSAIDLNHTDVSFYWQPVQGRFNFGLGFTIRVLDGFFTIRSVDTPAFALQTIDEWIPLPYFQSNYTFGDTGIVLGADVHYVGYDGDKFLDSNIRLAWESKQGLGAELGYRRLSLDVDDLEVDDSDGNPSELDIDLKTDGFYFGLFWAF